MSIEFNEYAKLVEAKEILEKSDLIGREFTKKEFDELFVGKKITTLESLKGTGNRNPKKGCCWYGYSYSAIAERNQGVIKKIREEEFEMPYKDNDNPTKLVVIANGIKNDDIDADFYLTNAKYREMVKKCYPNVTLEIAEMKVKTFKAKRYFYTIDMELLNSVIKSINEGSELNRYLKLVNNLEKRLKRYHSILDTINSME